MRRLSTEQSSTGGLISRSYTANTAQCRIAGDKRAGTVELTGGDISHLPVSDNATDYRRVEIFNAAGDRIETMSMRDGFVVHQLGSVADR